VVKIVGDDYDDDSFVYYDLLLYGCKCLIMQWWIGEDIIWWWKLYNIELVICVLSSLYMKVHTSWSCWVFGEERN